MLINTARAIRYMKQAGVRALLGTTIENTFYFAGLRSIASYLFPKDSQVYVLVTIDNLEKPWVILPTTDVDCLLECFVVPEEVFPYGTFYREVFNEEGFKERERLMKHWVINQDPYPDPLAALVAAIKKAGLSESSIAIDEKAFNLSYFDSLADQFPKAHIIPGFDLIQEIRSVKTPEEIKRLRRASKVNEQAISDAMAIVEEGITERELWLAYRTSIIRQGSTPIFELINFGANTGFGNLYSTEQKLQKGQHIRFDVGCRVDGYISDISRIFSFGEPTKKVLEYYNALRVGNEAGIEALTHGRQASEIFNIVVETVRKNGLPHYRRHHTGHGIGVEIYQPPLIAPTSDMVIENGMTLAIEAPYFEMGFAGLQIEDIVHVTAQGAEYLSTSSRDLVIVE